VGRYPVIVSVMVRDRERVASRPECRFGMRHCEASEPTGRDALKELLAASDGRTEPAQALGERERHIGRAGRQYKRDGGDQERLEGVNGASMGPERWTMRS
jgi:hypothetical protein